MKDFPAFTTENGVASLILREIPYREEAYIRIRSSLSAQALAEECAQFCTMCGAEKVYATGHEDLEKYPLHTSVLQMRADLASIPDTDAALFPVQEQTAAQWRQIYNERMRDVANASWMTQKEEAEMLKKGDGYFVHRDGELLGIGRASAEKIDIVIAVKRGAGSDVLCALCHALTGDTVELEVASVNEKAVHLYERLGFLSTKELSRWYRIR